MLPIRFEQQPRELKIHTRPCRGPLCSGGGKCTWLWRNRGWMLFICWVWQLGGWSGTEGNWRHLSAVHTWANIHEDLLQCWNHKLDPTPTRFKTSNTCTCLKRQHAAHRPTYWPTLVGAHYSNRHVPKQRALNSRAKPQNTLPVCFLGLEEGVTKC